MARLFSSLMSSTCSWRALISLSKTIRLLRWWNIGLRMWRTGLNELLTVARLLALLRLKGTSFCRIRPCLGKGILRHLLLGSLPHWPCLSSSKIFAFASHSSKGMLRRALYYFAWGNDSLHGSVWVPVRAHQCSWLRLKPFFLLSFNFNSTE